MKRSYWERKRKVLVYIGCCFIMMRGLSVYGYFQNQQNGDCIPEINFPGGRIAMSFDGNQHDPDDVGALPMSLAFTWAAGLQDAVTIVEHSNHICDVNNVLHGKMQESAAGLIERFGYDVNRIYDFYSDPASSTAAFVAEINKSTAANPLWIIAAGPMESIWRAINQSNKSVLSHVSIVSHSQWNEEHGDCGADSHTWEDLQVFEQNDGLSLLQITDQNHSNGNEDFSTTREQWDWLRDSTDPNLAWVHSRDQFTSGAFIKFDPSDCGMVYWLLTGGPNGGNERGGPKEAQQLLENPCSSGETANGKPEIVLKIPTGGDQVVQEDYDLKVEVEVMDMDGVEQVAMYINESFLRAERARPYEWGHDESTDPEELNGLPIGDHEIRIVAKDNKGATNETSFMLKVEANALSTPIFGVYGTPFIVHPNPSASGIFSFSESARWELYSTEGLLVDQGVSNGIQKEGLASGLYFLKAQIGASKGTMKLVVY